MADRAIVVRAMVGSTVHVREDGHCRPAIVLDCGLRRSGAEDQPPTYLLLRVLVPLARGDVLGAPDPEGWYHSHATAPMASRSDGTTRPLDAWHFPDDHDPDCRRFDQRCDDPACDRFGHSIAGLIHTHVHGAGTPFPVVVGS